MFVLLNLILQKYRIIMIQETSWDFFLTHSGLASTIQVLNISLLKTSQSPWATWVSVQTFSNEKQVSRWDLLFFNVVLLPVLLWVDAAESVFLHCSHQILQHMDEMPKPSLLDTNIPNPLMSLFVITWKCSKSLVIMCWTCSNRSIPVLYWTVHHCTQLFRHVSPGLSREGGSPHLNWWQFCLSSPESCWHSSPQNTLLVVALLVVHLVRLSQPLFQLVKPNLFNSLEISLKRFIKGPFQTSLWLHFFSP